MIVQNNGTVNVIGPDAFIQVARGDDDIQSPNLARTGDVGDLQILSGGLVNIDDGGAAVNFPFAGFNIAQQVNATGSVLIQGAGSKMTLTGVSSSNGNVGQRGAGTLTIEQGGTLESLFLNVGREASGDGTVIVQDVGSSLLLSGDDGTFGPFASIGRLGTGDLQVINGGVMTLDNLGFGVFLGINVGGGSDPGGGGSDPGGGGSDPGGTGTVAVSGAGSLISIVGDTGVFNVGRNGRGSLTVDTGGQITGATFFNVGFTAESIGTVTLDGPPSGAGASLELVGTASLAAEQNGVSTDEGDSAFLSIGVEGTAFMDVINGATVTIDPGVDASGMEDAPGLIIGGFGGSSGDGVGTLNVDGAGSQISVSTAFSSLNVGRNGTGFANIINGGVLTLDNTNGDASTFLGAEPGSFGTLIIDGAGSQLDAGEIFGIGFDHDFVDPFNLNPGGNGSLIVSNGASLTALDFFIDGSQSLPGFDPGGTAQIESGATVNVESVELGTNVGRAGKLSVSGGATTFSVSGPQSLIVGNGGDGFFDLFGGVTVDLVGVTNPGMEVGLTGTGSGLVNIVGAGSTLNIQGDGAFINVGNAGVGLMNVVAQATVTIDGAGPSQSLLQVGAASASGTLRLDNADVTITSVTDDSEILVGRDGASSGLVQLSSGARLAVLDNGRTIVAREAASTGDVFVQDATTSFEPGRLLVGLGSDEVTPGGTATIILDLGGTLTTNDFLSTGAVDIRDGDFDTALATLFDGTLDLGGGTFDSTGDMSVNDPALVDIASGVLSVGGLFSLDSMLSVQAGGTLNTFTAIMATAGAEVAQVDLLGGDWNDTGITVNVGDLGTAIVNVQGGSTLTTNRIIIGIEGNSVGTVNVFAGGSVNSNDVQMGEFALSSGAILIDGGVWTDTFNFTVSDAGVADITVINGGTVNSAAAIIGDGSASLATVLVDGSTWNNTGELVIGDDGDGSITVQNGGLVTVTTGPSVVAQRPGSIGVLIVADPTSQFDAGANLFIGVDPLLSPGGTGTLSLIGDPTVTATTVTNASLVQGVGTIDGTVDSLGGTFDPGSSPGIFNITGDWNLDALSTVLMEIASNGGVPGTDFDQVTVGGTASLAGDLTATLGFAVSGEQTFDIITCVVACTGFFDTVTPAGIAPAGTLFVSNLGNVAQLVHSELGTIFWDNDSGDDQWTNPVNWNTNVTIPGAADNVVIDLGTGTVVVFNSGGIETINSLNSEEDLTLLAGTLDIAAASDILDILTLTGGDLIGTGSLSVDIVDWQTGTIGIASLDVATTLDITGGADKTLTGTINSAGDTVWDDTGNINLGDGAVFNNLLGGIFDIQNAQQMIVTAGSATFSNDGTVSKNVAGLTEIGTTNPVQFTNSGTVEALAAGGTLLFNDYTQTGSDTNATGGDISLVLADGGSSGGNFSVSPGNFLTLSTPGTHTLNNLSAVSGGGDVIFSAGAVDVEGTYNITGTTDIAGGTANFNILGASTNDLIMSAGAMGGIGFFTTNTFDWRAGTVGVNSLDVVVSLDINTAGGKFLDDDLTLDGPGAPTGVWRDAADIAFDESASLTVGSGATFDIQNAQQMVGPLGETADFTNEGVVTKSGGGTTTIGVNDTILFSNEGSVEAQAGLLQIIEFEQTSSGDIAANGGDVTLQLSADGSSDGTFSAVGGGDTLILNTATTHSLGATSDINGAGRVAFADGFPFSTININGTYGVTGVTEMSETDSTVNFNTAASSTNLLIDNGTVDGSGSLAVDTFDWSAGNVSIATLDIATTLSINGDANKTINASVINNSGAAVWTGLGSISVTSTGGTFNNLPGATFDIQNDQFYVASSIGVFNNQGTLIKSAGSGASTFGVGTSGNEFVQVINSGVVESQTGTLAFGNFYRQDLGGSTDANGGDLLLTLAPGGAPSTGAFSVALGDVMTLSTLSQHVLDGSSSVSGDGDVFFSAGIVEVEGGYDLTTGTTFIAGGTARFNTAATTIGLDISTGVLGGTGSLIADNFVWTGGTAGVATLDVAFGVDISGAAPKTLAGDVILGNLGASAWVDAGDINLSNGASLTNQGSFDIQNDQSMLVTSGSATFSNEGALFKSIGVGTTEIGSGGNLLAFDNTGTVNVQSGNLSFNDFTQTIGLTELLGGDITAPNGLNVAGGTFRGDGSLFGDLNATGTAIIEAGNSAGTLAITGNFFLDALASTLLELGPDTPGIGGHDRFDVGGSADLDGTLDVVQIAGFITNTTYDFMSCNPCDSTGLTVNEPGGFTLNNLGNILQLDHVQLATIFFDNTFGDFTWDNPLNWDTDVLPADADIVEINFGAGVETVFLNGIAELIDGMFSQENLVLAGGSLELTGTGTINADLTLTGTALTLTDTSLSVSGTTNWDSGVASISGTGNGSFIVPAGQVMNVTGAGNHILTNVTLDNFGTVNMDTAIAATLEVNTNSLLNNNAGAVFDFFDDLTVRSNVGVGSFDNAGRVTKSGGIGTATIDTPFNGSAGSVVDPQTGQLSLIDGGIHSGSSLQADGGNLLFAGDHTFDNGTAISGSSNVTFLAGQHDLDGTPLGSSGTHSIVGGSTVTYVNGTGAVISGPLNNSGILELAPLDGVGLTLNDTLTNDGLFDIQDDVNIGGSGDLVTNVTLQKSGGGGSSVVSVPVTSTGLIDSQSGSLELTNGGAHNAGAILQVNPFGDLRLDGDHTLAAGGTITGNGRVFFDGGTHVLDGTYTADLTTVTGTSTVNFNTNANFPTLDVFVGGTANLNGTTYSADFVGLQGFGVDVPTINTSGALTVNSTMSVSDSVLTGSGSVNVANGALLGFTQPFATTVGVDIVNDGTLLVDSTRTDPVTLDPGVTITNNNLLDIVNDLGFDGSGTIDNIGTFQKRASAGTTPIATTFNNSGDVLAQSGTINFTDVFTQTAGSTQLVGGNLSATNPLAIDAGSLSGSGIVGGDVNVDAGTIVVGTSPGSITVDNLNLTDNSNIDTEIGGTIPGTEHDQIIVNDTANLDGTINVVLIGGFIPGGETFPLINCGTSCNGLFDATNLPLGFSAQPTAPAFNVQHNLVGTIFFDGTNILVDPFEYNDPLNWSTNVLPVAGDVAVIDLGGGNTITLSGGNHTVDQLFSEEGLSLDGGTLTLAGPGGSVFNDDLAMNGGNLNVADTLDVNADIAWTGASTIDGLGTGTFNIPGASTLTANAAAVFNDIAVVNAGTVNLNADLTLNGTTVFTNQAGATTDIQTAPLFIDGTGTFANEGILRKSALGAVATINADFANSNATIEATDTLRINSASAGFNGTTTLVGAGVELTSVNSTFAPGSVIDGTLTLDNAGTANVQGTLTINDVLNWLAGTVDGGGVGSLLLPGGAVVNQTGIVSFNDIAVSNTGSANLSADLTLGGTTVFTNEVGGVTDISSGLNVSGPGSFVNEGTLRKSAGGIASIAADFTNSDATIDAVTGLQVSGTNADFDGTLNILGGGFEIAATTSTFADGSIVDGTIKLATAGDVIVPGSLIFNDVVDWDDGNIDGQTTGTVTIPVGTVVNVGWPGTHTLTDVTFDNTGGLVNLVGADLLLAGFGVFNNLAGGLVDIQSDVNIVIPPGTSFNNFGVLLKSGGLGVSSIGAFSNAANSLIDVDSGTFQTTADLPNNGIINVANGTTFAVSGFFDNNSTGVIQGSGTIATGASGLTNSGEVIIGASPGILAISGNIVFTINGRLVAELDGVSPGTEHDQLAVTGSATLGGELEVRALGGFVPDIGIDLITCTATCSGNFDTLVESPNVAGTFFVNTTAPVVRLIHSTFGNIFFDNDVGDLRWADPLNWNTNFLPGAGDDPVINLGGGNTIVLDSGIAEVIDTLTIAENFEINGLTSLSLSNNGSSIAGDLTLTESSLIGNGNLTLSSALSAFTIDGGASGSVLGVEVATDGLTQFIGGSSQVTASGGLTSTSNVVFDGATTIATFDAGSLYNVTGDTTIRNGASAVFNNTAATGTLAVTGSSVDGAGTVNVSGATTWTGGDFLGTGILNSNGGLNIGNGGAPRILDRIVNVSGTSLWDGTALTISGGGTVNQSGTVDLQNTGLHDYGFDLVNTGTLDKNAGAGTVLLNGAADNDGTINVSQSSVRLLGGGEHDDGTFNTSGTGIIEFADVHSFRNDTSLNGIDTYLIDLVNPNTALNMNGPGVAAIVGMGITLDFNGQDVGGTAGLDVVGNLNFNAGSTITAFIQGSGNVDFAGNTDLAASQYNLSGGTTTIDPGVSLTLSNPALNGFTSVLNLNGSTDGPGSLSAGTFNLGPGSAINSNMIISTPTAFAQTVNGTGSIINNGVAVDFNADVNLDTVINSGGTSNFNGGTVGGTVTNSSGNANFLATTFNGVLDGSGTFDNATINGTLNSGVNLTGNNTVNTALSGSNTVQSGTTNFPGGYNPNPGTSMSVGAGATATASSFNIDSGSLSGGGTLGGNVVATGGSISTDVINGNVTLNGGTLSSTNTVNGNVVNNNGTVAPGSSPGTLVINGNFTQGANGLLTMELGGLSQGVDYDLVQITGNAALDGILDVKIFPPFIGAIDVFDLLTYASISDDPLNPGVPSTFANVVMPEGFEFSTSSNFNFDPGLLLSFRLNVTDIPFSETETPDATIDVLTLLIDADGLLDTLNKGGDDGDGDDDGDDDDDDDSEFSLAEDEGTTDDPTSGGTLSCTAASPAP